MSRLTGLTILVRAELCIDRRAWFILIIFYYSVVTLSVYKTVISAQLNGLIEYAAVENAGKDK